MKAGSEPRKGQLSILQAVGTRPGPPADPGQVADLGQRNGLPVEVPPEEAADLPQARAQEAVRALPAAEVLPVTQLARTSKILAMRIAEKKKPRRWGVTTVGKNR